METTTTQTFDRAGGQTGETTITTQATSPTPPPKPGWQTTEFWGSWAVKILGALIAGGVFGDGSVAMRIAGVAMTILGYLGYTYSRAVVKAAAFAMLFLVAVNQTACADAKKAGVAVVDCTKTNYQVAAVELVKCTTWSCVYDTAIGFGVTVGGCAFRALVDNGTLLAGSARSAAPQTGTAEFERFRAAIAGGAVYRTSSGDK